MKREIARKKRRLTISVILAVTAVIDILHSVTFRGDDFQSTCIKSEQAEVTLQSLFTDREVQQHAVQWSAILEEYLCLGFDLYPQNGGLEEVINNYSHRITEHICFGNDSSYDDLKNFFEEYGTYFDLPDMRDLSVQDLTIRLSSINQQISQAGGGYHVPAELYKAEAGCYLAKIADGEYNRTTLYQAARACQDVYEVSASSISFTESTFWLTMAFQLYKLVNTTPDGYDSSAFYKMGEIYYKLSRINWHNHCIQYNDEADSFVNKHKSELLLMADACMEMASEEYSQPPVLSDTRYLYLYLGELNTELFYIFYCDEAKYKAILYLDKYKSATDTTDIFYHNCCDTLQQLESLQ